MILWYKQTPGQGLILLGHLMMQTGQREDDFIAKVELKGDATKSGSLTIKDLSDNDSAVYFCASSLHSDINSQTLIQKLSSLLPVSLHQLFLTCRRAQGLT